MIFKVCYFLIIILKVTQQRSIFGTVASTKSQVIFWKERSNSIALTFLIIFYECCPSIYFRKITWSPTLTSRIIRCARCLQGMVKPFIIIMNVKFNKKWQGLELTTRKFDLIWPRLIWCWKTVYETLFEDEIFVWSILTLVIFVKVDTCHSALTDDSDMGNRWWW